MKALLIAPAEAPGLDPLAYVTPPPLLPLLGAPLATPLLRRLADSGVTEIVLACRTRSAAYERFLLDGRPWGLNLAILEVGDVASTQLTLESVRALGFHNQTLAILPANCWTDADWPSVEAAHRQAGGGVSELVATDVSTGVLLVDPGAAFSPASARPLAVDIRWRPLSNWREYWALAKEAMLQPETGVAPLYASADGRLRVAPLARIDPGRCEVSGPVWLGPGAAVDPGAVLRGPVWIGPNCRVGPGVTLESCAIESAAHLHGPLALRNTLVIANRAIALDEGAVQVLDEQHEIDTAMTSGLLNLATSTACRAARVLQAVR